MWWWRTKAMASSRMTATVSFHQNGGMRGRRRRWMLKDGDKPLASQDGDAGADGVVESETVFFNAGDAGVKSIGFSLSEMPGEENAAEQQR
jgi:hypothetical protein